MVESEFAMDNMERVACDEVCAIKLALSDSTGERTGQHKCAIDMAARAGTWLLAC